MNKNSLLISILMGALAVLGSFGFSHANTELVKNGNFSNQLNDWVNESRYMGGTTPYSSGVSIVDDSPKVNSLKLSGVTDYNYYVMITQEIDITSTLSSFNVSFDWKVTVKEPTYGYCQLRIDFFDSAENQIGIISYLDDGMNCNTESVCHDLEYMRGDLNEDQSLGVYKYLQVFDWEHVSINTSAMTGMDHSQIAKIKIWAMIQNDAGQGGEMLIDNLSITRPCTAEMVINDAAKASGNTVLTGLRAFRDHFLSKGEYGKSFIRQYYQHSAEGIRLMMEHPEWITRSAGLLEKIQPALLNAADTGALQLDESILQEIMSLMDEVKPYTSPELSQFIDTVQSRLLKRQAMTP